MERITESVSSFFGSEAVGALFRRDRIDMLEEHFTAYEMS